MAASNYLLKRDPSSTQRVLAVASLRAPVRDYIEGFVAGQPVCMWVSLPPDTYEFTLTNQFHKTTIKWVERTKNAVSDSQAPPAVKTLVSQFKHVAAIERSWPGASCYSVLPSCNYLGQSIEFRGMPREWRLEVSRQQDKHTDSESSNTISGVAYRTQFTGGMTSEDVTDPSSPPLVFFVDAQGKLLATGSVSFATYDEKNDALDQYNYSLAAAVVERAHSRRRAALVSQKSDNTSESALNPVKMASTGTGVFESRAELLTPTTSSVFQGSVVATGSNRNTVNDPTRPLSQLDMSVVAAADHVPVMDGRAGAPDATSLVDTKTHELDERGDAAKLKSQLQSDPSSLGDSKEKREMLHAHGRRAWLLGGFSTWDVVIGALVVGVVVSAVRS